MCPARSHLVADRIIYDCTGPLPVRIGASSRVVREIVAWDPEAIIRVMAISPHELSRLLHHCDTWDSSMKLHPSCSQHGTALPWQGTFHFLAMLFMQSSIHDAPFQGHHKLEEAITLDPEETAPRV